MTSVTITAKDVSELRARTGAGILDCRKALEEANGDMDKASELLRAKGIAKAEKRAGRSATQGLIVVEIAPDSRSGAMVELNCETDFVARTPDFQALGKALTGHVLKAAPVGVGEGSALEAAAFSADPSKTVGQVVKETSGKTGEAIAFRRYARFEQKDGVVAHYLHHNGMVGVLVAMTGPVEDVTTATARDVALHIASADPIGVRPADIPAEMLDRERRIAEEQVAQEGKPEQIRGKIVEGKLRKFVAERTLLEQPFVRDDTVTVGQLVAKAAHGLEVIRFARFQVGA
ncbi:MAG TPA: translation elongation factor Ts [Gemmatimonadales bacterium]|jgi:elongation factor Ts|nr:translation elongation factor Ts [Gemmatimonadales bacterium]